MKTLYISDLLIYKHSEEVRVPGWIGNVRRHGAILFWDLHDSTGVIQVVIERKLFPDLFEELRALKMESAVQITGFVASNPRGKEIHATGIEIISFAQAVMSPGIRNTQDIFNPAFTDHLLTNRHLYLRNPKINAILRYRHLMMHAVRVWFHENRFMEITAPVLTALPLYEDGTAMSIKVHDEDLFLTQCVGFYLEACVHAFERVYNMGPSFRGEESRSKRHLMEYWHIKAEAAFGDLDDIIRMVESLIHHITSFSMTSCADVLDRADLELCTDGLKTPYPRITYRDAIERLKDAGVHTEFGKSLSTADEEMLSKMFPGKPFWVVGIPRSIEPFPYTIDPNDNEVTMTADLIASNGMGELLGVAEKIVGRDMLLERMEEKGKANNPDYEWIRQLRDFGPVPHIAFGMGVERLIRWLLNIPHVRDAMPFPRIFRRKVYP